MIKQDEFEVNMQFSGFTNSDLEDLIDLSNHKATYIGSGLYVWERKEKGVWVTINEIEKTSSRKIRAYINFNIERWSNELTARTNKGKSKRFYYESKRSRFMVEVALSKIKTKEKIRSILEVYPDTTAEELSKTLYIGVRTIFKHLSKLSNDFVTVEKENLVSTNDFEDESLDELNDFLDYSPDDY